MNCTASLPRAALRCASSGRMGGCAICCEPTGWAIKIGGLDRADTLDGFVAEPSDDDIRIGSASD